MAAVADARLACGNCREAMQRLVLPGHYGAPVEIDLCMPCHLAWFDGTEAVRLPGVSMLTLIKHMAEGDTLAHRTLRRDVGCVRCRGPLKAVHNRSRWGRSMQLECRNGHGAYQPFGQLLADRGLLRPLGPADRATLLARDGHLDCVGCGSPIGPADTQCLQCEAVPALFDVARLARALDPEGVLETQPVHQTPGRHTALGCPACGAAGPASPVLSCPQCGATLAVSRLGEAAAAVATLGDALRAHALRPSPQVVARRLARIEANLPAQRAAVRQMEAEARQRGGGDPLDWGWDGLGLDARHAVVLALALAVLFWLWG